MTKKRNLSSEDIKNWDDFVKNPKEIIDKDSLKKEDNSSHYRFKFDLHGFSLDGANTKVKEIVLSCVKKKYKEILLITGKGLHSNSEKDVYSSKDFSKLKYSVPEYIKSNQDLLKYVLSINTAGVRNGGEGAIIIKLKNL